jgi:hypothetical protein
MKASRPFCALTCCVKIYHTLAHSPAVQKCLALGALLLGLVSATPLPVGWHSGWQADMKLQTFGPSTIDLVERSSSSSEPCLIDSAISNYIETHKAGVRGKDSLVWNFDSPPSLDVSFALSL